MKRLRLTPPAQTQLGGSHSVEYHALPPHGTVAKAQETAAQFGKEYEEVEGPLFNGTAKGRGTSVSFKNITTAELLAILKLEQAGFDQCLAKLPPAERDEWIRMMKGIHPGVLRTNPMSNFLPGSLIITTGSDPMLTNRVAHTVAAAPESDGWSFPGKPVFIVALLIGGYFLWNTPGCAPVEAVKQKISEISK